MRFENFIEESMLTESNVNTIPPFFEGKLQELLTELAELIDMCYGMRNAINMRDINTLEQWAKDIKNRAGCIPVSVDTLFSIANLLKIDIGQK